MSKLITICGPMFAGKSTRLINEGERYAKAKQKVVYLKPSSDTRYSVDEIVTHDGIKVPASLISNQLKDRYVVERADVVLIDEVQFMEEHLVQEVLDLVNEGKTVIVAGLDTDYLGQPFPVIKELMPYSDEVVKIKGICRCGKESTMTSLKKEAREQVKGIFNLGSDDQYEALCRSCFNEENKEKN